MTAASRIDASSLRAGEARRRQRRPHVVALACVAALSLHVLGWFVLQWTSSAAGTARPKVDASARIALSVRLIPEMPPAPRSPPLPLAAARIAPDAGTRGTARSARRSAVAPNARNTTRSLANDATGAHDAANAALERREQSADARAAPDVDWARDLATIGSAGAVGRSAAQATVNALGASAASVAPRRPTVDATLASGMSNARRADCRNAYAGAGLLALPMLALDAVRDTGCKW
jgi:hypothetical protein